MDVTQAQRNWRSHIPVQLTRFIGRKQELSQVRLLLAGTRLLTLTGAGGCGKTRLAAELSRQIGDSFSDRLFWVDLAPLSDPALVPQSIAGVLGIDEVPTEPLAETLSNHLGAKHLLLVLDNCEHVLSACAELAERFLIAAPRLQVLATSREPFGLAGETAWLVPSLSMPEGASALGEGPDWQSTVLQYDALHLFVERAAAVTPTFGLTDQNARAIVQVCQRVDGIPLAIELAAARTRVLTVEQIATRLDDRFALLSAGNRSAIIPRHRTLRAAIDWSHNLLSEPEQLLYRRLSVFAGGFSLEAAESVCAGHGLDRGHILDLLTELVDKSMVVAETAGRTEARYRLLETMRAYAREKSFASDEPDSQSIRDAHLDYFLRMAEATEPQTLGPTGAIWLDRLEAENDDLRAALRWSLESENTQAGLRLACALGFFWVARNHTTEGREWMNGVLSLPRASEPTQLRARALNAAVLLHRYDNSPDARVFAEESMAINRELGDKGGVIRSLDGVGFALFIQGCHSLARAYFQESLNIARELHDKGAMAIALNHLGDVAQSLGDLAAARSLFAESVLLLRAVQDKTQCAISLFDLGGVKLALGEYAEARARFEEALKLGRELDIKLNIGWTLQYMGNLEWCQGNPQAARPFYEEAMLAFREMRRRWAAATGLFSFANLALIEQDYVLARSLFREFLQIAQTDNVRIGIPDCLFALASVARREGDHVAAGALYRQSLEVRLSFPDKPKIAYLLEAFAAIATDIGEADRAVRLFAAAEAEREATGIPCARHHFTEGHCILLFADREERDRNLTLARHALGETRFAAAWAAGRAMSLDDAIAYATTEPVPHIQPTEAELRIYALGPVTVYRGQQLLASSDWTYAKSRELLLYFLMHEHRTKEQIGLDLWPDDSPAQLRSDLGGKLYYLRHALGRPDWILFEDHQYCFNRALNYWFDVEAFESHLAQARRLQAKSPRHAIGHLEAAVELYRGDFLEDVLEGEWFLERREHLQRMYLEALLMLGELLFARGDYPKAAEACRRAIAHDSYLEAAHRELMRCYARLGERGQALRHYEALVELMTDELGSAPAEQTTTLYESIRRGEEI